MRPISVTCGCGKSFRAKVELAGKRVKCPECGQALVIPNVCPASGAAPTGSLDFDQLMSAETAAETLRCSPLSPSKKSKKRTNTSNPRLFVGLSVVTGAAVLVLVLLVLLWPSRDKAELAKEGTTPGTESVEAPLSPSPPPAPAKLPAARTYPSFPDAATRPPVWNDVEPPFDLAEFPKAPPDEENAAPL